MTVTTEPAFYDQAMTEDGAPAMLDVQVSPWRPLYQEAAAWIPLGHDVVDLGTGTGRFLAELRMDDRRTGAVSGVDFSQQALAEAQRYLGDDVELQQADLRQWEPNPRRAGGTTYACLEVLEHLADDIDLVQRIPLGHQLVFSVPSYESEAHLFWCREPSAVVRRYGALLDFRRWSLIQLDARKVIHVFDTARRSGTWS